MSSNMPWNILLNQLALIGRVPFDCGSSCGERFFNFYFFASVAPNGFMANLSYTLVFK